MERERSAAAELRAAELRAAAPALAPAVRRCALRPVLALTMCIFLVIGAETAENGPNVAKHLATFAPVQFFEASRFQCARGIPNA